MEIVVRSENFEKNVKRAPMLPNRLYFFFQTELKGFLWLLWSKNMVSRSLPKEMVHFIKLYRRNKA